MSRLLLILLACTSLARAASPAPTEALAAARAGLACADPASAGCELTHLDLVGACYMERLRGISLSSSEQREVLAKQALDECGALHDRAKVAAWLHTRKTQPVVPVQLRASGQDLPENTTAPRVPAADRVPYEQHGMRTCLDLIDRLDASLSTYTGGQARVPYACTAGTCEALLARSNTGTWAIIALRG